MNKEAIEALGLDIEEIKEGVIEKIANEMLHGMDQEWFSQHLSDAVEQRLKESIDNLAAKNVIPHMQEYIDKFCLQLTNKWGEKKGDPVSFAEYLVERAEHFILEPVDYEGKAKRELSYGQSSWRQDSTRAAYLIDKHLHYNLERALKEALLKIDKTIAQGLLDAFKCKLEEFKDRLTVKLEVGRR